MILILFFIRLLKLLKISPIFENWLNIGFMKKVSIILLLLHCIFIELVSQKIILGGVNSPPINVTQSDQWQPAFWQDSASGNKTIDNSGLVFKEMEVSRFLYQAGFGGDQKLIKEVANIGIEEWLNQQFNTPLSSLTEEAIKIQKDLNEWRYSRDMDSTNIENNIDFIDLNYAWWTINQTKKDILRQRIGFALSEIFVISQQSNLQGLGLAGTTYYDKLLKNSFGNFRTLIEDVTLDVAMGVYLSHLNNPKSDTSENIHPDENYAREVMQLFTIGLFELNLDGSYKLDSNNNRIPTYTQKEIKEFAKIFTGLGLSAVMENPWIDTAIFGVNFYYADFTKPMRMYDAFHEPGQKILLNGRIIPEGQTGMKDIKDALDILYNHPNTGPFFAKQLIQRLIKSNPTPGYIERVAKIFNDDGSHVRGNLKAVIKAILLDDEARDCDWLSDKSNGQLREPLARYVHFVNAMNVEHFYNRYWNTTYDLFASTTQMPLAAPNVFNFYSPNFSPGGELKNSNLVAPEFKIHNSRTSIAYMNLVNNWVIYNTPFYSWEEGDPGSYLNIDELKQLARDPEVLINKLDILFTHGQLSPRTRNIIKTALDYLIHGDFREDRVRLAVYLICISPDYSILK